MIKSKKLQKFKNINHGFFNNAGGVSTGFYKSLNCGIGSNDKKKNVIKNLKIVSKKIGIKKKIILLHQLHSNKIFFVNKISKKKLFGDGLITNVRNFAIGILTADCAPILFFESKKNIIGIAHAGWRGAYKKIGLKMINYFKKKGGKLNDKEVFTSACNSISSSVLFSSYTTRSWYSYINCRKWYSNNLVSRIKLKIFCLLWTNPLSFTSFCGIVTRILPKI